MTDAMSCTLASTATGSIGGQLPPATATSVGTRAAAVAAASGLAMAGALHVAWARGSTWPAEDSEKLAALVVGAPQMPSSRAAGLVAGLLGSASVIMLGRADLLGPVGRRLPRRLLVWGATVVAAVMLLRGVGGVAVSGLVVPRRAGLFHRWDARLYSPLCLVLGALGAVVARSRPPV